MQNTTLYRHADGELRKQPERNADGKITQRYNRPQIDGHGNRFFERTAEIPVRSLKSVGGERPNKKYTRRSDRKARGMGFINFEALRQHIYRLAKGDPRKFAQLMRGLA